MTAGLPSPVLFLDSVSPGETLVVCAVALLLFGAKRLPEAMRTAGRTIERLRRAADAFRNQLMSEMSLPEDSAKRDPPSPPPAGVGEPPPSTAVARRDGEASETRTPDERAG